MMKATELDLPLNDPMRKRMESEYARMGRYAIERYRKWLIDEKEPFDVLLEQIGEGLYKHIFK